MEVPPLRRRVVGVGVVAVALALLAFDVFVYLNLRSHLEQSLEELLAARAEVAAGLAEGAAPDALADQLARVGVPAVVRAPDGRELEAAPATPRAHPAAPPTTQATPRMTQSVPLPGGGSVEVAVSRAGVDRTLGRLVAALAIGTIGALIVAGGLLVRAVRPALAPLDHVVRTAERTAAGVAGARLRPVRDDTELGRMAAAFDRMLDALEDAQQRTEAERQRTQRFLSDAAHQLRTPITGVRASAELLLSDPGPEAREQALLHTVRESARAGSIISGLLRMARLEQVVPLRREPTDVVALCRSEVERARQTRPDLDIDVVEGPLAVAVPSTDPAGLADAVGNLVDNARRHAASRVRVHVQCDHEWLEIAVEDDGPGLPGHARDLAFERFVSLDGRGGTGLGLPIARAVARSMGGDLHYEDGRFVLRAPLTGAEEQRRPPGTESQV